MYDGAQRQIEKGKDLFQNVLSPLASLSDGWKHLGFKVFPEVENRKFFIDAEFSEEDVKVTAKEISCVISNYVNFFIISQFLQEKK